MEIVVATQEYGLLCDSFEKVYQPDMEDQWLRSGFTSSMRSTRKGGLVENPEIDD